MSGHSHYATIKRQKESRDAVKGKVFSKLARAILIAVKTGGGTDPDSNARLRMAIDTARASNMPKENIERAISKGAQSKDNLDEVTYEGYGPNGVAVVVEVATDNRNRASQEMKNIFERGGGSLAGPGSVAFNFEQKGLIVVSNKGNTDEQMLSLIEAGAEDIAGSDDGFEVYVSPEKLSQVRDKIQELGFEVSSFELTKQPKNLQVLVNEQSAKKVLTLLENFENHDDVQKVYANIEIPAEILKKLKTELG
jgi:YebC/PmpR family DNA-binding regulatory protein